MHIKKDLQKAFGLSPRDAMIIEYLGNLTTQNVTLIAKDVGIPRTTVSFLLKKLQERNFVERVKVDNHFEWGLNRLNIETVSLFEDLTVTVQKGLENIKKVYKEISNLSHSERIFIIQGSHSTASALERINKEFFIKLHDTFKKRKIVIEGIIGESTLQLFNKMESSVLSSHYGRAVIAYVVPDKYTSFDADIVATRNRIYIFNFGKNIVVTILNPAIILAFHSLLTFMEEHSEKIDLNKHIQDILDGRKE